MQSEFPQVFHHSSPEADTQGQINSLHYGNHHHPLRTSPPLLPRDEQNGGVEAVHHVPTSLPGESETVGLSHLSPLPRNRISEYENAMNSSPKPSNSGPSFVVVKRARELGDENCSITKLPNEVLTHVLSYLPPADLSSAALVSRRFRKLVTNPYAWRVAFARFFPGPHSLEGPDNAEAEDSGSFRLDKRLFTRLTALASWRSEYILRTGLLRSLARGKAVRQVPPSLAAKNGQGFTVTPFIMYDSGLFGPVNILHANFGNGLNKSRPLLIHGCSGYGRATTSDATAGKVTTPHLNSPSLFTDLFEVNYPGVTPWGLGAGEVVVHRNVMDISQQYGMVVAQGVPEAVAWFQPIRDSRGRPLVVHPLYPDPALGVPAVSTIFEAVCSVWIAKSPTIPSLSGGLVGLMVGSSSGIISSYSLGNVGLQHSWFQPGELTARWVLSPGVPIIGIAVDESYSLTRHAQNRVWAIALNALGEVFYLTKFPSRSNVEPTARANDATLERIAWATGRTVYWNLIEPTRRKARVNPYEPDVDGSYSPRSSWNGMCLSKDQIKAETRELEEFIRKQPKDFRIACHGWDMRRRIEVDFAGDDGNFAGESVVVFECGLDEGNTTAVRRYTRLKVPDKPRAVLLEDVETPSLTHSTSDGPISLFGNPSTPAEEAVAASLPPEMRERRYSHSSNDSSEGLGLVEEWRSSEFSLNGLKTTQISSTAIDNSSWALLTLSEDPLLGLSGASNASSPYASPLPSDNQPATAQDIPGQRSRLLAAGTKTGCVILWDMRSSVSKTAEFPNVIDPIRIVYTESPEITSLALTALCVIHGGSDGLVQAWDPLASSLLPIRTLNSRLSSRARRRLAQGTASQGIGQFSVGAICLDPDPTVLRGVVAIGALLLSWSYSSSVTDQYKSHKRKLRRNERGVNNGGERSALTMKYDMSKHIANERVELEWEERQQKKEADRLAGRFGVDLLDSEEDALAYATMLSQESLIHDEMRRQDKVNSAARSGLTPQSTSTPEAPFVENTFFDSSSPTPEVPNPPADDAILHNVTIKYTKRKSPPRSMKSTPPISRTPHSTTSVNSGGVRNISDFEYALQLSLVEEESRKQTRDLPSAAWDSSKGGPPSPPSRAAESSRALEMSDLEYALQLSLMEEESRRSEQDTDEAEEFPALSTNSSSGRKWKGKGRA